MIYKFIDKRQFINLSCSRRLSSNIFNLNLSTELQKKIEDYWIKEFQRNNYFNADDDSKPKFYSLSMFPYPSGNLHMGHVRVYTISDVIARFHRLNGANVFQPIGWDAFGLPAENAAMERSILPYDWTWKNICDMKKQLEQLCCTFDWQAELTTCSPDYYKWTQYFFLKMYDAGLVYQKESLVNWDPVDSTVLAEEQVSSDGRSWRSGVKVEKKILKQWFIRTTKFSQALYDELDGENLQDWDDVIDIQKNWIGDCDGFSFDLKTEEDGHVSETNCLNVWVRDPVSIIQADFLVVRPNSFIHTIAKHIKDNHGKLCIRAVNPFTNRNMPIYVSEDVPYPFARDVYVGTSSKSEIDREFAERVGLKSTVSEENYTANQICEMAQKWCIGGYPVSSKIQDWLISRQRYWGTPIPIVHCVKCGAQPIPYDQLPVTLPTLPKDFKVGKALHDFLKTSDWKNTTCPKCGGEAFRDSDTMDTFVDSSWYYLRYTDVHNKEEPFNYDVAQKLLPVDFYVGGKEHALLHLYYARFFSHFLHSIGMVNHREPFRRLLCQGMVKGRTYKTKAGKYLKPDEVLIEGQTATSKETNEIVEVVFEKMSKSKFNGVNPQDVLQEYGIDSTRLFLLYSVCPKSHREWDVQLFHDVNKWLNRLWLTVREFINVRENRSDNPPPNVDIEKENASLRNSRNTFLSKATYQYLISQQLAACIVSQQMLLKALRNYSREARAHCKEYENALAALIISLAPLAPHVAATLWFGFVSAPGRLNANNADIRWDKNVFEQKWPQIDADFEVPLYCQFNKRQTIVASAPSGKLTTMTPAEAFELAQKLPAVKKYCDRGHILNLKYRNYENLCADLDVTTLLKNSGFEKNKDEVIQNAGQ